MVDLPPEVREAFEHVARETGVSIEDHLAELIEEGFREFAKLPPLLTDQEVEEELAREDEILHRLEAD